MRNSLLDFVRSLFQSQRRSHRRRSNAPVAGLEKLEDRALLAGVMDGHLQGGISNEVSTQAIDTQVAERATVSQSGNLDAESTGRENHGQRKSRGQLNHDDPGAIDRSENSDPTDADPADETVTDESVLAAAAMAGATALAGPRTGRPPVDSMASDDDRLEHNCHVDGSDSDPVDDVAGDDIQDDVADDESDVITGDVVFDDSVTDTVDAVAESSEELLDTSGVVVASTNADSSTVSVAGDDVFLDTEMLTDLVSIDVNSEDVASGEESVTDDVVIDELSSAPKSNVEVSPTTLSKSKNATNPDASNRPQTRRGERRSHEFTRFDDRRTRNDRQEQHHRDHSKVDEQTPEVAEVRSIDGTGNNTENSELGSAGEQLLRVAAADYADGISEPAGEDRPSAREISNALSTQSEDTASSDRDLSAFIYVWGQFLDHDIDLTESQTDGESFDIAVPAGDPLFDPDNTGTQVIPLTRSMFDESAGTDTAREQITQITSWIDGSQIYGSDTETAASLRSFEGGRLLISDDGLLPTDEEGSFIAGDIRANENIELTSMQTLFVREHNLQADQISTENPELSDEDVYQQARAIVIAEIQAITYNEYLPALLGIDSLSSYDGYDSSVDPSIANEFSTAAFRFGHSTVNDDVEFFGDDGLAVRDEVALREAFFNPDLLQETGIDSILKYTSSSTAQEIDLQVVDSLRNFLFGEPGQGGLDLVALNIQRGRDHGLADYNTVREAYGLERVESFADITSDVAVQETLAELYGSVDNIDLWVGGLAEDHMAGSSLGETFQTIIADQFTRLRDGDRFWYQNVFSGSELEQIEQTSLADIIMRNTNVSNLQDNVFFMTAKVSGQVFAESGSGASVGGIQVQLLNDEGSIITSTLTDSEGRYLFNDFDETGEYQIHVVLPSSLVSTSSDTLDVLISRGGLQLSGYDFGISLASGGLV